LIRGANLLRRISTLLTSSTERRLISIWAKAEALNKNIKTKIKDKNLDIVIFRDDILAGWSFFARNFCEK
jgi:hypothetical protein